MHGRQDNTRTVLKIMTFLYTLIFLTTGLMGHPASAQIYRWQDENGHWHYSDSPTAENKNFRPVKPSSGVSSPLQSKSSAVAPSAHVPGGLLWQIVKDGQQPSYLLGTIHSADPRVTRLRPAVSKALDASDRFVMEMTLDANAIMQFGTTMMIGQGEDLKTILGAKLFGRVVNAMAGFGMPEMVVHQLKPWVVMAILSMPPPSGGMILDLVLHQRAAGQGKPVTGLETAQEQLAVFEGLSRQDQIELLELTLDHLPSQPATFEQLIEAYVADDLNRIARIAHRHNSRVPSAAAHRFMLRLNDQRNVRMVRRIIPYLEQTNSFIAVGALHLAGNKGILAQLRRRGYTTTPMR